MSGAKVVRAGDAYVGKQGLNYVAGLTGASAGTHGISMTVGTLPPGARAKAHLHEGRERGARHEGEAGMFWGDQLSTISTPARATSCTSPPTRRTSCTQFERGLHRGKAHGGG
jgi:uncharacterized RmlC-like cupin family protein